MAKQPANGRFCFYETAFLTAGQMACGVDIESHNLAEEVELLQAIYIHELELQGPTERPTSLTLFLHPSTGDDDDALKFVCLSLHLAIPQEYPCIIPEITIKNPRGLSEAHINSIQENLIELAKDKTGSPMLYDLIEYAKECLTDNNIPSCPCVICLEHFHEESTFIKTKCYHYFHSLCLRKYVNHFLKENEKLLCPMCRLGIDEVDLTAETKCEQNDENFVYKPDEKELEAQRERQRILEYQKQKGGTINIEEERNKYLIGIKNIKVDRDTKLQLKSGLTTVTGKRETVKIDYEERKNKSTGEGIKRDERGTRERAGKSGDNGRTFKDNVQADRSGHHLRQNYRKPPRKQELPRNLSPRTEKQEGKDGLPRRTDGVRRQFRGNKEHEGITGGKQENRMKIPAKRESDFYRQRRNFGKSGEEETKSNERESMERDKMDGREMMIRESKSHQTVQRNKMDDKEIMTKGSGSCPVVQRDKTGDKETPSKTVCTKEIQGAQNDHSEINSKNGDSGRVSKNDECRTSELRPPPKNPRKRTPRKPRKDFRNNEKGPRNYSPKSEGAREQTDARTNDMDERNFLRNNPRKNDVEILKQFPGKKATLETKNEKYFKPGSGGGRKRCPPPPGFEEIYGSKEQRDQN